MSTLGSLACGNAVGEPIVGTASTCADGVRNGDETGIDCGGGCAACTDFCARVTEIPMPECQALVALYTSTDGANWTTNTDWLMTTTPCGWHGVTCVSGRVIRLNLGRNNLVGPIPPAFGSLTSLVDVELPLNQLRGPIPPELGNLTSLTMLNLSASELTGPIPPELGNLASLTLLSLHWNELTGPIPPELGNLTSLSSLSLYRNELSGDIPPELGNLSNLYEIYLHANHLVGVSPNTFDTLSGLAWLFLDYNLLDQANVDQILSQVYAARALYTAATPTLSLHGTNATPSGTSSDPTVMPGIGASNSDWSWNGTCHDPLSGMARIYALQNDPCAEGFSVWSVTYNR